jgi:phenylacetate-CoA ligase
MIWNKESETMSRDEMRRLQENRLQEVIRSVYEKVPFYRQNMDKAGVRPGSVKTLKDIEQLPFTVKQDMRDNYPYGLLASPMKEIVRVHASSGTTGKPTVVAYTRNDLDVWGEVLARTLAAGGLHSGSVFQVSVNYGLFTGGLGMHYAAERIGAAVVPASGGNSSRQVMLMKDFGTTAMVITPSYALHLAEVMREMGTHPGDTALESVFCGAEAWSDKMHEEVEDRFGVPAFDVYGLSEIIGPGVACECEAHQGLHVQEDHFYPEVIDPVTGRVLPEGEEGELVLTTLTRTGTPMIRYRTRDLTALEHVSCSCGRTQVKMRRVLGRNDDMLIIRGVNVFPSQVESVLLASGETSPHYQLIVKRENNLDTMTVVVERHETSAKETLHQEVLSARLRDRFKSVLGVNATVQLVEPHTLERSEGKAKRVIDLRKEAIA